MDDAPGSEGKGTGPSLARSVRRAPGPDGRSPLAARPSRRSPSPEAHPASTKRLPISRAADEAKQRPPAAPKPIGPRALHRRALWRPGPRALAAAQIVVGVAAVGVFLWLLNVVVQPGGGFLPELLRRTAPPYWIFACLLVLAVLFFTEVELLRQIRRQRARTVPAVGTQSTTPPSSTGPTATPNAGAATAADVDAGTEALAGPRGLDAHLRRTVDALCLMCSAKFRQTQPLAACPVCGAPSDKTREFSAP